jgi:MFS transporter, ACS family, D-galactonate transporter
VQKLPSRDPRLPKTSESGACAADTRWWVVGLLFLGMLINYIDRGNLSIAAVPIMHELHLSNSMAGVTLSAFFWTYLVFQFPAGYFVDRAGLRLSYGISFLVWTLSSAAVGLVHSVSGLISLRLLLGMGESVAAPASLSYIKRNFHGGEQGLPNAFYLSGMTLGPAVGVFLGGVLLERVGWRTLFVLTGLVSMLWLWPWLRFAPSSRSAVVETDIPSATPESKPNQAWRRLLLSPVVWGVATSSILYGYYSFFCFTWLPSYLVMSRGYTYIKTGTFMALPLSACALSCIAFGRLADWLASTRSPLAVRKGFVIAGFLLGTSILLLIVVKTSAQVLAVLFFFYTSLGLAIANFWAITQIISPTRLIGRFVGCQNAAAVAGGACAPIVTGRLLGVSHDFGRSFEVAALCLALAAVAIFVLIREPGVKEIGSIFTSAAD